MLGLKVISTVSSDEKALIAVQAGADYVINYRTEDILDKVRKYTNNSMLDGMIDVDFGSNLSWSIEALKPNSDIATYASSRVANPVLPFYPMMFKQITLKPIFVYILPDHIRKQSIELVQKALQQGILKPLIQKIYKLEEIVQAHQAVESGDKIGQVLIKILN